MNVGSKHSKPAFQGVIDLGLRDVGVRNDPRGLAAEFGKTVLKVIPLVLLTSIAVCVLIGLTGVGSWAIVPLALAWLGVLVVMALRMAKRSPMTVVKVSADGTNQATWLVMAPFVIYTVYAAVTRDLLLVPVGVLGLVMIVLMWRGRTAVPDALRELRTLLAPGEAVLGDGVGRAHGVRKGHDALRIVAATDRRLLVVGSTRASTGFLVLDAPYERVSRFGIEWKYAGRFGTLTVEVAGAGDAPPETHVVDYVGPANLLSVAQALQSHGVEADDPRVVAQAERLWEEAKAQSDPVQRRAARRAARQQLLDRAAMNTEEFDRGLWLLLGVAVIVFYVNPLGIGMGIGRDPWVPTLLILPLLCAVCGYVSRTGASLTYLVPLNLLMAPAFFFVPSLYVIALMLTLTIVAALTLSAGGAIGRRRDRPVSSGPRPVRGTLRYTLGGVSLIRLTGGMLGVLMVLVVTAGATGHELTALRLAIDEKTLEQRPVDGRSNLTAGAASITYTAGPDLREFITDHQRAGDPPNDGARWELRSTWQKGFNVVSLASYVFEPRLDDPAAIDDFVERKNREHRRLAGEPVTYTERTVKGRKAYVWDHGSLHGWWYYAAWFPQPGSTVRIECIASGEKKRFKRLCAEAVRSLELRGPDR